jgi:hypothetical protein
MNSPQRSICISLVTTTTFRAQREFGDQYCFMSTSRETLESTSANQAYEFGVSRRNDLN